MEKSKVTIVGGGIAGLSLALILADHHVDVSVIEKGSLPFVRDIKPSARTAALMTGSLSVLERAGVWPEIRTYCAPLETLTIIDDSAFPRGTDTMVRQEFQSSELGQAAFGYNIPLGMLSAFLAEAVRGHTHITLKENKTALQNDPLITGADLVVGADGRESSVRKWRGIGADIKDCGQKAITCVISHSLPNNYTSTEFHRNGGPCTFVPMAEHKSAVVWVEKSTDSDRFMTLPKASFVEALQQRSRGILGKIEMDIEPQSWPLSVMRARRLTGAKTVLIAEAAHVLPPIGAQGLNLSMRDVNLLADTIMNAVKTGQDIGGEVVLAAYEKSRQRDIAMRYHGVDLLNSMVANDNPFIRGLRRIGLRGLSIATPLRHYLMSEGLSPKSG